MDNIADSKFENVRSGVEHHLNILPKDLLIFYFYYFLAVVNFYLCAFITFINSITLSHVFLLLFCLSRR